MSSEWAKTLNLCCALTLGVLACSDASEVKQVSQLEKRLRAAHEEYLGRPDDEYAAWTTVMVLNSDPVKDAGQDLTNGRSGLMLMLNMAWGYSPRAPGLKCENLLSLRQNGVYSVPHGDHGLTAFQKAFEAYAKKYNQYVVARLGRPDV